MKEQCDQCYGLGFEYVNFSGYMHKAICEKCDSTGEIQSNKTEEQEAYLEFLRET